MTTEEFKKILDKGETDTVEFKSWVKARSQKEIISLAVDELIAFANHKGGTIYFGVEDQPIEVTGCSRDYDSQRSIEGSMIRRDHHYLRRYMILNMRKTGYCDFCESRWENVYNHGWQMLKKAGKEFKTTVSR